jgi:(E)-4-hydroxy-3-methylbut-2-enyl-diphosphate synthase
MRTEGQREYKYIKSLYSRERLKTRIVDIGDLPLGGDFPVRVQSMTNTPTSDIKATVAQSRQLFEAGCDYVRITARNVSEARDLEKIKKQLHKDGFRNPLIADIHFNPEAARVAAKIVEKVRINPGNYIDREDANIDWLKMSDNDYNAELERISLRIKPLIDVCKEYGTTIRIGTNHGSLSQRILSRYGNTPEGMVQSALEFTGMIAEQGFHKIVLSMKASDIHVMVHAYRLLVSRMMQEGFDYPLHLGVTEAGAGEDGIIKSASGLGPLLADGIGDTIRVSLTGDPLAEVPVAKKLAVLFDEDQKDISFPDISVRYDPFTFSRRKSESTGIIGGDNPFAVIPNDDTDANTAVLVSNSGFADDIIERFNRGDKIAVLIDCSRNCPPGNARCILHKFISAQCRIPVILNLEENFDKVSAAAYLSTLLIDGYGDAIRIEDSNEIKGANEFAYSLLQAHGLRRTKAEYIACPTCGRTSYNIEKVLQEVQNLTKHLTHLKIAVMGCIINGPGEMADADFGCVGSARGKVNIYRGKEIILKDIPEEVAAQKLLEVIIKSGRDKE